MFFIFRFFIKYNKDKISKYIKNIIVIKLILINWIIILINLNIKFKSNL